MNKQKIVVVGLGYVGFPLACAIAKKDKYDVYGYDLNQDKVDDVNNGKSPVEDETAQKDIKKVSIKASTKPGILNGADIIIVAVPTPVLDDKTPNLKPIKSATKDIVKYLEKGQSIIIESTINPGVCEEVVLPILEESGLKGGKDFDLAHCPERINPGDPKWNVYNIPRNIGSTSKEGTKKLANFYRNVLDAEINEMKDLKHAEATKIIENTFRDINIAYVNELAKSFDVLGLDIDEVIQGASNKPFAFMPHFPSCGVGGHCIPVDPYFLIERAKQAGFDHKFLRIARDINNSMPEYTVKQLMLLLNEVGKSIKGTKITLLGLSYKKNISDMRESPALEIQTQLKEYGADLITYEPYNLDKSDVDSIEQALDTDAVVIGVDHDEFVNYMSVENLKDTNIQAIVDGKNCLSKSNIEKTDILYKGIGR